MKKLYIIILLGISSIIAWAQSPIDAYTVSQQDLRGTARFMSMGGAFGALGADLSTLSQNPGGIGVYRSSEVGITFDLDAQSAQSDYQGYKMSTNQAKLNVNNVGIVGTFRLKSKAVPNLNIGFTYNKALTFNRHYKGGIRDLKTSLSNYIAGIANNYNLTEADLQTGDNYDPYIDASIYIPWSTILAYDSYLITPGQRQDDGTNWYGQFGNGTTGSAYYNVREYGGIDEYNIALGGNIANRVFWGMNFGISSLNYNISSDWGENLKNAYVFDPAAGKVNQMDANWNVTNLYNMSGNGFNYSLGVIVRPIQELRIGFAFHTPTWYNITENFGAEQINYNYPFDRNYAETNDGYPTSNVVNLQTPWKIIASIAGIIGTKGIISFDYEWNGYKNMRYSEPTYYEFGDGDWWNGYDYEYNANPTPVEQTNQLIKTIYRNTHTLRIGGEYRVLDNLSLRLGYNFTTSPVTTKASDNLANVPTSGTMANFRLDNEKHYITAGIGYRVKGFSIDAAYIYKHASSQYYPFSADPDNLTKTSMVPKLNFDNSQVVLSLSYKF